MINRDLYVRKGDQEEKPFNRLFFRFLHKEFFRLGHILLHLPLIRWESVCLARKNRHHEERSASSLMALNINLGDD